MKYIVRADVSFANGGVSRTLALLTLPKERSSLADFDCLLLEKNRHFLDLAENWLSYWRSIRDSNSFCESIDRA